MLLSNKDTYSKFKDILLPRNRLDLGKLPQSEEGEPLIYQG